MLTICWCPCVESSRIVGRWCLLWPVHIIDNTLLAFALLHAIFQGQICLLLQVTWLPNFAFQSPIMKMTYFWGVLKCLVGLQRTVQLQFLQPSWLGHRLGLLWYWIVCLGKEQRSFCLFEIASKYCISDSFVDHDGYSISSEGFLPAVVDIMIIWVKFTHSSPF